MSRSILSSLALFGLLVLLVADSSLGEVDKRTVLQGCSNNFLPCIRIGFTYSGTGSLSPEGLETLNGYLLWGTQVINSGGLLHDNGTLFQIELIYYDDNSNATQAISLYRTLIETDFVDYLLGPYGSSITQQVLQSLNGSVAPKVFVFGSAANEDTFSKGYQNIFRVSTTTKHYLEPLLTALKAQGARTIAIAHTTVGFGIQTLQGGLEWIGANSFTLLGSPQPFPMDPSEATMTTVLQNIKSHDADIVAVLGLLRDGELIVNVSETIGLQPKAFIITSAPSEPDFIFKLGSRANNLLGPAQWHPHLNHSDEMFGTAQQYANLYQSVYNEVASFKAAQATAAAFVLGLAIQSTPTPDQADVAQTLRLLNRATFFGHVHFNSAGENIGKPMLGVQVLNGNIEIVSPAALKEFDPVYPRPYPGVTPTITTSPPTESTSQPTQSTSQPTQSTSQPTQSTSQTTQSTSQTTQSTSQTTQTTSQTTQSTSQTAQNTTQPTQTTSQSTHSTSQPETVPGTTTSGNDNPFPACATFGTRVIDGLNFTACLDVKFVDCEVHLITTIDNRTIGPVQKYPISRFKEAFDAGQEVCAKGLLGCELCTFWHDLTLDETHFYGCGSMDLHCSFLSLGPYELNCFSNTEVIPRCFGSCPDNCNFRGSCVNAFCECEPGYEGDACERDIVTCPNDCGGSVRGQCVDGKCVCSERFTGEDCSSYIGEASSTSGSDSTVAAYAVGFTFAAVALIGIIAGIFYYRRKMRNIRRFGRFNRSSSVGDSKTHSIDDTELDRF